MAAPAKLTHYLGAGDAAAAGEKCSISAWAG